MAQAPHVLNVHTPTSSFAIVHSLTQESLLDLYNKVSRKHNTDYYGERVGPGWLKYEYNDSVWNLDDDSDYTIFVWRQQQQQQQQQEAEAQSWHATISEPGQASTSRPYTPSPSIFPTPSTMPATPTLHLHNPKQSLPVPPAYVNRSYYMFQPSRPAANPPPKKSPAPSHASTSKRSKKSKSPLDDEDENDGVPKLKKQFDRFHSENGVRTVMGTIGPVHNVRMLLKTGHRHVYISRKFAIKHGFIPPDAAPGNYGYGGLVNIGTWPITLTPSSKQPNLPAQGYQRPDAFPTPVSTPSHTPIPSPRIPESALPSQGLLAPPNANGKTRSIRSGTKKSHHVNGGHNDTRNGHVNGNSPKPVMVQVYLSEEPHFDVVLGRSFIEKRNIKMNAIDPTDVVCLDTGEKIECELVILKDGRGEIVTVT